MNREQIKEKVIYDIKTYLDGYVQIEDMNESTDLKKDLGIDSSRFVDLALEIEKGFNVELENQVLFSIQTVGDVVNAIEQKLSK
jgi:acyl carrier protein